MRHLPGSGRRPAIAAAVNILAVTILAFWGCPDRAVAAAPAGTTLDLDYAAYVHGFRAMVIAVDVREDAGTYTVALRDHTVGLVGAMIDNHVSSVATGRFEDGLARPARYASSGHSRGADRVTRIDDANGAPVVRVLTPVEPNRDRVPAAETVGAVDPLSAMASLIRQYAATGRCEAKLRVFDGARLSTVQSWTAGTVDLPASDASPFDGRATECDFRTEQIGGFLHDANYARSHLPEGGRVWLAPVGPGGEGVPIRARFSTVEHGEISLFLTSAGVAVPDR